MSSHDWTFGGQLNNIVEFAAGQDVNGNPSYAFTKKEPSDGSTTLYLATDHMNFSTYTEYTAAGATGIQGSPTSLEYGPPGKLAIGTTTAQLFELDISSIGQMVAPPPCIFLVTPQKPIVSIEHSVTNAHWAIACQCKIFTEDVGGSLAHTERLDLNALVETGSNAIDIAAGPDGWMITVLKPDNTTELIYCSIDWATIKRENQMQPFLTSPDVFDINYSYDSNSWYAAQPKIISGLPNDVVLSTSDINTWLL